MSVESKVAEALNLKLGDTLVFVINSQRIEAVVNSIRKVEWREMKPNFYFIFAPELVAEIPGAYMVSYRLEDKDDAFIQQLSASFPTVSFLISGRWV
ncbi:hypothetical protein JCM19231_4860 [Vibrio ishigakensis]|uniref:Uncharacterized protein n=1 Tax=Vibrio ishigakensis TaxID=1481914 RepID=A0A0B8NV65_9VIBR|nr:hypothetical protein JCM19231_4860 [Vibrio ishigakensis]